MTNAERQAAYRARRKNEAPTGLRATVTEVPVDVAALRAELMRYQIYASSLSDRMHKFQEMTYDATRRAELAEAAALKLGPATSNDKSVTTAQWLALLGAACTGKTKRQKDALGHSVECRAVARLLRGRDFDSLRDAIYGSN
ncbi:hypothetical protein [Ralstonia mannitolilytica]|uniref:hypothetical protein n=1 Tax=Ralstonia mannitolilytica TaxID=105219 RepID=UPI00292DFDB7|nr:hypothetical protein [Ralstonia mannitolilytica]